MAENNKAKILIIVCFASVAFFVGLYVNGGMSGADVRAVADTQGPKHNMTSQQVEEMMKELNRLRQEVQSINNMEKTIKSLKEDILKVKDDGKDDRCDQVQSEWKEKYVRLQETMADRESDASAKGDQSVEGDKTPPATDEDAQTIHDLAQELRRKLQMASGTPNHTITSLTCEEREITQYRKKKPWDDSCDPSKRKCLRTSLPYDLEERVRSLVASDSSHIPNEILQLLEDMRRNVTLTEPTEVIIVSATSSNHFTEVQALLKNFHQHVHPVLKNFTLIIYDIGLTGKERLQLEKHCKCRVASFPFHRLPVWHQTLKCFTWKVMMIAAHYMQADVVVWTDSSIRIQDGAKFVELIERTKRLGVQQRNYDKMDLNPFHTLPVMFQHYGDSPCTHMDFRMCEGNFGVYHREPLIDRAVIQPWLACAIRRDCMCQEGWHDRSYQICSQGIPYDFHKIGMCHRFDQSAISIILAKLFREKYYHFAVDTNDAQRTHRGNRVDYFKELEKAAEQSEDSLA